MITISNKCFVSIIILMWGFKVKGGSLDNLLEVVKEYFGIAIYERIWAALVDIWDAIGTDNRLCVAQAELAAQNAGFDLCKVATWQKMKQGDRK